MFLLIAVVILMLSIAILWASIRTITTDLVDASRSAPLDDLDASSPARGEDKRLALAAIYDLADEHALGKIVDADYAVAMAHSRADAKMILRDLVQEGSSHRRSAEELARDHLRKHGFASPGQRVTSSQDISRPLVPRSQRADPACASCATANDADAIFCKRCGARLVVDRG